MIACSGERAVNPQPAPGGPAYWESNVPAEPGRPQPGSRFEEWPSIDDAGISPEGTRDKFLWEDVPPSQIPHGAVPSQGELDGGVDAGEIDAGPVDGPVGPVN